MPVVEKEVGKPGNSIKSYKLITSNCSAVVLSYGAILSHFTFTKSDGSAVDVVLGFDDALDYVREGANVGYPFFGAFVGRACNRTAKGHFTLEGKDYHLPINNGPNSLHGGLIGFDKQYFSSSIVSCDPPSVAFEHISPHMDQGFPGSLKVVVKYSLIGSELVISSYAELIDEHIVKTYVNLTAHPYFNLSGLAEVSVEAHTIKMEPSVHGCMELDENQIPTEKLLFEEGTPELFFYVEKPLSASLPLVQKFRGFDHFYLVEKSSGMPSGSFISISCPLSGIKLDVDSSSKGFQFYTGNWLDGRFKCKKSQAPGTLYGRYSGFCIEPSEPPNAINMPKYSSSVTVTRDQPWKQTISYRLSCH